MDTTEALARSLAVTIDAAKALINDTSRTNIERSAAEALLADLNGHWDNLQSLLGY